MRLWNYGLIGCFSKIKDICRKEMFTVNVYLIEIIEIYLIET